MLTNIHNNFNNIGQLNTINLQPLVASFLNKNLTATHQPTAVADAFDPRTSSPEQVTGNRTDPTKDTKWDQNQSQVRKQPSPLPLAHVPTPVPTPTPTLPPIPAPNSVQMQVEAMKMEPVKPPNKQQLMQLLLKNYK